MAAAEAAPPQHGGPYSWGPKETFFGIALGFAAFVVTTSVFVALLVIFDRDFRVSDVGGPFVKASEVVSYAGERLDAARRGQPLPSPPELFADTGAIKLGFITTLFYHLAMLGIVLAVTRQTPGKLAATFRLDNYSFSDLWLPAVVTIAAYAGVIGYSVLAEMVDIGFLKPESTVPDAVTRDGQALLLAGILACGTAPIAEEAFFRGLVFSGFSKYGFFVAAGVSGVLFTLAHLDPGSVIPFFGIAVAFAWLYWRRGRLWDSIAAHFMFNATSFILLAATG